MISVKSNIWKAKGDCEPCGFSVSFFLSDPGLLPELLNIFSPCRQLLCLIQIEDLFSHNHGKEKFLRQTGGQLVAGGVGLFGMGCAALIIVDFL